MKNYILDNDVRDLIVEGLTLIKINFEGINLENVIFRDCTLEEIIFRKATLTEVNFEYAALHGCNFDGKETLLEKISFKNAQILHCRFRGTIIKWSDFRYANIHRGTFEAAYIQFCDFYRAEFHCIVVFKKSKFENCSINHTYFEWSCLRKENLVGKKILPENHKAYKEFQLEWAERGTGGRKNDRGEDAGYDEIEAILSRYEEAEDIYNNLNGLWQSKGFIGDSNWAFVKAKKMQRKVLRKSLFRDIRKGKISGETFSKAGKLSWNVFKWCAFGYGESILKTIVTYFVLVVVFSFIYFMIPEISIHDYLILFVVSLKNMVAMTDDSLKNVSVFVDFLNFIQTSIGIIITGIFGFIIANKIRNS